VPGSCSLLRGRGRITSVTLENPHHHAPRAGQTVLQPVEAALAPAHRIEPFARLSDPALSELGLEEFLDELLMRVREALEVDTVAILLHDPATHELVARAAKGIEEEVERGVRIPIGQGFAGRIAAERVAVFIADVDHADILNPILREKGIQSLLGVPLVVEGELIGVLHVGSLVPRVFGQRDLAVLQVAAARAAPGIERARLFSELEREHQVAMVLQRSLLPKRLIEVIGVTTAARYLPATDEVGGDWYDVFELARGRLGVAIGDVVGHGVRAATTMSELRNALRAFAVEGHSPGAALQQLDRVVHATFGAGMIATVLFLIIDASKGTVSLSRAGHPPPALRTAGGEIRFLETGNTLPLGIDDRVKADEAEYPVNAGDTLLLFTDGLVERRRESINTGFDRLRDAFATAPAEVDELCDYILERTVTEQASHDDIAVLAVRVLGPPLGALELTLPAKASSVPLVRHRLRVWLTENVPELDAVARCDLEVAWSEACTNVIRHAYGPGDATFQATAARDGDAVSLSVRDAGQWRPPRGQHGGRGIALMRELVDEVRVDRRSEGTTVTMRRKFGDRPAAKRAGQ
jgi:GAF domain-containing protein/anti-sigma regulatory factor (Ser/Thr protein kinase)